LGTYGEGPLHGNGPLGFVLLRLGWAMGLGEHPGPYGEPPYLCQPMANPSALVVPALTLPSEGERKGNEGIYGGPFMGQRI